jgi:vacuolar protein sorting-associated protein 3
MNYSPHLAPNTRTAPPTVELRKILNDASLGMLESFLSKHRAKRHIAPVTEKISAVSDTFTILLKSQQLI